MEEYEITMSSGEVVYILAANLEDAAWTAFELSKDMNTKLKDVALIYVKEKEVFPQQLGNVSDSTAWDVSRLFVWRVYGVACWWVGDPLQR